MKSDKAVVQALLILAFAGLAHGATTVLRITRQTTLGSSVFVTAELPELGALTMTKSLKMIPTAYPEWQLPVELPPGSTITPRYYLRTDEAGTYASTSNGTLIATGSPIVTPTDDSYAPQPFNIHTDAVGMTFVYTDATAPVKTLAETAGPAWLHDSVPALQVAARRLVRVQAGTAFYPGDRPVLLNGRESWWRHGQGFLELPGDVSPAVPRGEIFSFTPTGFRTRSIRVHLPRGYDANTTKRYPVIYAMDGQNLRSYETGVTRPSSWDLDLAVNDLTAHAEMPEAIIVGVDNTADRFAEYTPNGMTVQGTAGRGTTFLQQLRAELVPLVNSRYRTVPGPATSIFVGSSLGGLLGFQAASDFEDTWGTVIAMSPSFWVSPATINSWAARPPAQRARLWIDLGTLEGDSTDRQPIMDARDAVLASGDAMGYHFFHVVGLGDNHNEAAWKRRSPAALRWAFQLPPVQDKWLVR